MDPNGDFPTNQRQPSQPQSQPQSQQSQSHTPQKPPPQAHTFVPPQPHFTFPQNFDFNSLPPAERELLLRRFQLQQQQQAQLQRALQAQAQVQGNFQRMTMNAYTTPRPPLNSTSPPTVHHPQGFPLHMNPQQQIPFNQMMARPVMSSGINPNLLQQPGTGIKQINPQQFTNPLQAPLKSDPLLYTPATMNNATPVQSTQIPGAYLNLPPWDEQVMSSEGPNKPQVQTQPQNVQRQASIPSMPSMSSMSSVPSMSQQSQNQPFVTNIPLSQPQTPVQFIPQTALKHIPESELALWKPFADVMKVPIGPICDIDTAILYINSPYFTLKVEALLATQKLFAQASPKELQLAGISTESLNNLLESLEGLWNESIKSVPVRTESNKTMETFWSEVDNRKRDIFKQIENDESNNRAVIICRQIASLLRTLTVTKGPDVAQFLARSDFIKLKLLPFGLVRSDDWELYKDSLVILESIASHLGTIEPDLLEWNINQCKVELKQVRNERLFSMASKFTGSLNLDRISSFENINVARQSVSVLITQSAQLWKSVPAHMFLHLSSCLSILTSTDSISFELDDFVLEIEKFMDIFVLPTVSLLRSVRGLYECQGCSVEEVRRVLETVIYSPSFSLTDGGFLEICLQILTKCHSHQPEAMDRINWAGIIVLLRELREFWRHEDNASVANLGKSCYQVGSVVSGSPAKPARSSNNSKLSLAIVNGASSINSTFSHPFVLLCKSLDLLASNFQSLPDAFKLDLLELALEWNLDTPSKWGKEVLASEKFDESLNIIREYYE